MSDRAYLAGVGILVLVWGLAFGAGLWIAQGYVDDGPESDPGELLPYFLVSAFGIFVMIPLIFGVIVWGLIIAWRRSR